VGRGNVGLLGFKAVMFSDELQVTRYCIYLGLSKFAVFITVTE